MYFNFNNDEEKYPTLRRSQTVTTFGVGAITDFPDASVIICSIDRWDDSRGIKIYDPRLESKLGFRYFLMAPEAPAEGVLAVRFPKMMRCRNPAHAALKSLKEWEADANKQDPYNKFLDRPYCSDCKHISLVPSRFVVACRKGHIDDFPFSEWVHKSKPDVKCSHPELKYYEGTTASLGGIIIKCMSCNTSRTMAGVFTKEVLEKAELVCKGAKPWEAKNDNGCGEKLTTLQRGATNVHFPVLKSSILIPPYSTETLKTKIINTKLWEAYESEEEGADLDFYIERIAKKIDEPIKKVTEVVKEMVAAENNLNDGDNRSEENYRYEEYLAFKGEFDAARNKEKDFQIEPQRKQDYDFDLLESVVLAKKLREIRVQIGFSRIKPPQGGDEISDDTEKIELMPVTSDKSIRWRPGYEVRGEGIFIEFSGKELNAWAKKPNVKSHYAGITARSLKTPDSFGLVSVLSPEFIFVHTMSHLLIRQLSFECGYPGSALRERLYCTTSASGKAMYGLLIYTAEGDSDGTLGGLVRQGKPDLFTDTLAKAIDSARWCSSDPLCVESDGQGFQAMNLAACHSCCMLPETSCEMLNRYLDRASIVGTLTDESIGLFSH